jgi:hypothetical protein
MVSSEIQVVHWRINIICYFSELLLRLFKS